MRQGPSPSSKIEAHFASKVGQEVSHWDVLGLGSGVWGKYIIIRAKICCFPLFPLQSRSFKPVSIYALGPCLAWSKSGFSAFSSPERGDNIYIYNVRIKCCQLGHSHVIQDLSFHQRAGRIGQQEPRRLPEYPGHVGHGEIWLVGLTKTVRDIRAKGRFLLALETFLQAIEAKEKASW